MIEPFAPPMPASPFQTDDRDALFQAFMAQYDDAAWLRALDRFSRSIHPVDRAATRIWFGFYPLALQRAMDQAEDPARLASQLVLQGAWRLADQLDRSHWFLFGHRYWPQARRVVLAYASRRAAPGSLDLAAQVHEVGELVAAEAQVDASWVLGISAVALRMLQHVGFAALEAAAGDTHGPASWAGLSPDQVLARRAKDDSRGLFGFLKGGRRTWTIRYDERDPQAIFPLTDSVELTTAAGLDRSRDHRARDPRCSEGPIPVHCKSCTCGTCWVGVLGGAEKLSAMEPRERAKLAELGYGAIDDERPVIRLACMAQAFGAVTLVLPPWNGQLNRGRKKA
jgi:ferredoxin